MLLKEFGAWVRAQIEKAIPEKVVAINFNLYEAKLKTI